MRARLIYLGLILMCFIACNNDNEITTLNSQEIQVEVADMQSLHSRAMLFHNTTDIIQQGEFALNAYLENDNAIYFTNAWVYYFIPDDGDARWRFRDVENQENLINFYWPNDDNVNFFAYMPRTFTNCACKSVSDINYNSQNGVHFKATMPNSITDITAEDRIAENAKQEFVYACRLNQGKDGGNVKLRFVHPFAGIKFRLHQSHRDLVIHGISLRGIKLSGEFDANIDTYQEYHDGNNGQAYLTYNNWTTGSETSILKIDLEKSVPNDINYMSQIGGPYMAIPQILSSATNTIELMVEYTWNKERVQSAWFPISTSHIPAWQPGNIYTYTLDLGDNKEEILFKVVIEQWSDGEDYGFDNEFEVT